MELRIVIVDDNPEYRYLLRQFIERGNTFVVVGEASNGDEAIHLVDELQPEVVVMDVMMPVMDGVKATRSIKKNHPKVGVIALTHSIDQTHADDMFAAGVDGYFLKSEPVEKLLYQLDSLAQAARPSIQLDHPVKKTR